VKLAVAASPEALFETAAECFARAAAAAIRTSGSFKLALSGGSTPSGLYALLASPRQATRIEWSRVHVFWGDERCVAPSDPESNQRMARAALLDHVPLPAAHVHAIRGEGDPDAEATRYEQALRETRRWVMTAQSGPHATARVTLTPVVINAAAEVIFLVSGRAKAAILKRVLFGPREPDPLPAQAILPRAGELRWLVDADAASALDAPHAHPS